MTLINTECPICLNVVKGLRDRVVTKCGHVFHCNCLMQNIMHNGLACPCCRTLMAVKKNKVPKDDSEYVLTNFRLFNQLHNGEEFETEYAESAFSRYCQSQNIDINAVEIDEEADLSGDLEDEEDWSRSHRAYWDDETFQDQLQEMHAAERERLEHA